MEISTDALERFTVPFSRGESGEKNEREFEGGKEGARERS